MRIEPDADRPCLNRPAIQLGAKMTNIQTKIDPSPLSPRELQAARHVVSLFLTALKNRAMYPAEHAVSRKFLANVHGGLQSHLSNHDALRIYVIKDGFQYKGESIYQESEAGLAFSLFGDGITWLEFQPGIQIEEVDALLQVLNQYKEKREEAEGDVATALWDLNLPHLRYEATDVLWEADGIIDLARLNRAAHVGSAIQDERPAENAPPFLAMPESSPDTDLCVLSGEEQQIIRRLVAAEEVKGSDDDALDILFIILREQKDQEDFKTALSLLREEFYRFLLAGQLRLAVKLLEGLRLTAMSDEPENPWVAPRLADFFTTILTPDQLPELQALLASVDAKQPQALAWLRDFFLLLPPTAVATLAPLLEMALAAPVQQVVIDAIKHMAAEDPLPLEKLLAKAPEGLLARLLPIIGGRDDEKPAKILVKFLRHHASTVRRAALGTLAVANPRDARDFFFLIDDPDPAIRDMVVDFLGRERSPGNERLLLDYLARRGAKLIDQQQVEACYRALGRCGSSLSLPFLEQVLLGRGWNFIWGFGKAVHRRAAAQALGQLMLSEGEAALSKAAHSLFPAVRKAAQSRGHL